jgi:6-phosphogluconolactonase
MSTIQINPFASQDDLTAAVVELLCTTMTAETPHPTAIMLSGGTTPRAVFAAITAAPVLPSPNIRITFTDERHVPVSSPESNLGQTIPMLDALGLGEDRLIYPLVDAPLEAAAADLHAQYARFLVEEGRIPLALLGLGADGHTCSLFTAEDVAACGDHFAAPVLRPKPPHRITVGPALLRRAERIIFLVAGRDKDAIVAKFLHDPLSTTAGLAVADCSRVELWNA